MKQNDKLPKGMSQLDYLWLNFGNKTVKSTSSEDAILTETAIVNLVRDITKNNISNLIYEKDPDNKGMMRMIGKNSQGSQVVVLRIPEEIHVVSVENRKVTQEDLDNGYKGKIGQDVLVMTMNNDSQLLVNMNYTKGGETNSIVNNVVDGVMKSHLKVDDTRGSISIKETSNGVYAEPKLSKQTTGVFIEQADDGLLAKIPIGTSGKDLKVDMKTYSEYLALIEPAQDTMYFITDKKMILLNGVSYGNGGGLTDSQTT